MRSSRRLVARRIAGATLMPGVAVAGLVVVLSSIAKRRRAAARWDITPAQLPPADAAPADPATEDTTAAATVRGAAATPGVAGNRGRTEPIDPMIKEARSQRRATWFAAIAAGLALVVSAGALGVQVALNRQQDERQQRVYSARVAVWAVAGSDHSTVRPDGLDVSVYNRSPAPVYNVVILAEVENAESVQRTAKGIVGSVPPCSVAALRLAAPAGWGFEPRDGAWQYYDALTVRFDVAARSWVLTTSGLRERDARADTAAEGELIVRLDRVEAVGVCGEAS